ncbi:FkbM family methyltransferase [Runella sp.]|uniref:FkbM family methyltransferase n=1 Tax=Runella sp. TaxID=1960881 RepID=UPI003D14F32F
MSLLLNRLIRALELIRVKGVSKYFLKSKVFSISSTKLVESIAKYTPDFNSILDIGANHGQFLFAARTRFPNAVIHSFEPLPELFDNLQKKTAGLEGIYINNTALSNVEEEIAFYESEYSHISSALKVSDNNTNPKYKESKTKEIKVACTTLNTYVGSISLKRPTLLKIDAQGLEKTILEGANKVLGKIDYIVLELAFEKLYDSQPIFEEIHDLLSKQGFALVAPMDFHTGSDNKIIEMDALYKRITHG